MDVVERNVRSWIASEKEVEIDRLVAGVSSGSVTFLDIVKALGEYLTSEEDALRTKGVQLLTLVIERCPQDKFSRRTVRVLTTFYCSKLEDTETITPALKGLSHLVTLTAFSSSEVSDVLSAIFKHVNMPALVQSTRYYVYGIINSLADSHRDNLKNMGEEFLSGYATLASGEKDPRNLSVAFKIARMILTNFDISKHVESYFDITFCYFPITFRPPPNDPYGIHVDDLKNSLRLCLNATPAFGSPGMSLLLEKLTIGSPTTKRDVLLTMSTCFPVYGPPVAREFGRKVWSGLKLEIFQPTDNLTEETALDTFRSFVAVLQASLASLGDPDDGIRQVAQMICNDSLEAIGEPEKAQAKAGMKVLCACVSASANFVNDTITDAVKKLIELFYDPAELSNRAAVIMLLIDLLVTFAPTVVPLETSMGYSDLPNERDSIQPSLLIPEKDALLGMLTVGLKSSSTRLPAVHGLSALIRLPAFLTDTELGYIVLEIGVFIVKEPDEVEDVTTDVLSLLSSIAQVSPQHLVDQTLPTLFAMLPDRAPPRDSQKERAEYWRALVSLSKLCTQPTLFEILVIRLIAKLELLSTLQAPLSDTMNSEETERSAAYAHAILTALANTLSAKVSKSCPDPDVSKYGDRLLPHLFRLFLVATMTSEQRILTDPRLLRVGARIVRLVVEVLSTEQQQRFINGVISAFLHGKVNCVSGGEFPSFTEEFRPMHIDANAHQRETLALFAAAHVPIHKEVSTFTSSDKVDPVTPSDFLKNLVRWCDLPICNTSQRGAASDLFATLVNKYTDDVSEFLGSMVKIYWTEILGNTLISAEVRSNAIKTWVSVSRGLVVRSHPLASSFVDRLFTLLDDDSVSWSAARAIGALAANDQVLTKRNGAVLKILHVQKYFDAVLPKVVEGAKKVEGVGSKREMAYLVALSSLVNAVPNSLYAAHMSTLMPLLLRGLEFADSAICSDIIDTLSKNLSTDGGDKTILSTYASSLVVAMLRNCVATDIPEPRVRVAALKYLALLPGAVRYDLLHPYKSRVLKELAKALDDPKRAVRKEAVNARTQWYKYSG